MTLALMNHAIVGIYTQGVCLAVTEDGPLYHRKDNEGS